MRGATEQLIDFTSLVSKINSPKPTGKKLIHNLDKVQDALRIGNTGKACSELFKFIQTVQRECGKTLSTAEAVQLIDSANRIKAVLGC